MKSVGKNICVRLPFPVTILVSGNFFIDIKILPVKNFLRGAVILTSIYFPTLFQKACRCRAEPAGVQGQSPCPSYSKAAERWESGKGVVVAQVYATPDSAASEL